MYLYICKITFFLSGIESVRMLKLHLKVAQNVGFLKWHLNASVLKSPEDVFRVTGSRILVC